MNQRAARDGAAASPAAPEPPSPRPRNYLAAAERRRLFWSVFPLAAAVLFGLGWLERAWVAKPPPGLPDVDTRLESVAGRPPTGDEVVIEREAESLDDIPAAGLSASRESLARVRDATFFREADQDAWFQTWNTLRDGGAAALRAAAPRRVEFREIFGQPGSFRGRLVSMRGTLHRLEEVRAPANDYRIERYWQGWLEPEGGPSSPVVVQSLTVPAGMRTGMAIDEPVEVIGYFFKTFAYAASDTVRVAPVIMTLEPWARPRPAPPSGSGLGSTFVTVALAASVMGLIAATWLGRRSNAARPGSPSTTTARNLDDLVVEADGRSTTARE